MRTPDMTYKTLGMFTLFLPQTSAGEIAWLEIAKHTEGTGKVLCAQAAGTISQLKAAGYTVHKAKPCKTSIEDILNELEG